MYLIKQAKVYDPKPLGKKDVLLGGGKILRIADSLPAEASYGVEVIDGTGLVMFPGLIDAHVHILGGGGEGGARTRTPEIMLSDITKGGVTTVVGCLGTDGCTRTMTALLAKAKGLEE
jgi:beta-aspartyl-dipeptidase (metallo-type)